MDFQKLVRQTPIDATAFENPRNVLDQSVSEILREMEMQEDRLSERIGNARTTTADAYEAMAVRIEGLEQAFDQFDEDVTRYSNRMIAETDAVRQSVDVASYKSDELKMKVSRTLSPAIVLSVAISVLNLVLCCMIVSMVSQ